MKATLYSQVCDAGLILDKKPKYTMHDVNKLMQQSLFNPVDGATLTLKEAAFIVRCSAIFWNTEYASTIAKAVKKQELTLPV